MQRGLCGAAICGLMLAIPATASGDGLPVQGVDAGATGVTRAGAGERYVTLPAGRRRTVVARIASDGGQVLQSIALDGRFTIPAVALDGSASGLSADGSTLALIRPRVGFPQRRTRLALLDAGRLRLRGTVTLRGDFGFDAVSPDGRSVYLIEYLSRRDPNRYAVRVYDTAARRLLRKPIVDPREPDERMRGMPITRATSPDGRWAYTLYDGAGGHPFVHALDTVARTAACIDLDALAGDRHLYQLRFGLAGRELSVVDGIDAVAAIDRTTFRVGEPAAAARPRPAPARGESGGDVPPWTLLASTAVALLLAVGTALRMRSHEERRRRLPRHSAAGGRRNRGAEI